MYNNTTSNPRKGPLHKWGQSTYFKLRVGCTRWSIRQYMEFYFYPVRQSGRIGKKGKKAKTGKSGHLWWIRHNRTSRTYRMSKDKWQGSHKDGCSWAEGVFFVVLNEKDNRIMTGHCNQDKIEKISAQGQNRIARTRCPGQDNRTAPLGQDVQLKHSGKYL